MIFNEIDKKNIVRNKVNLKYNTGFVFSSGENEGFDHKNREMLEVEKPGTYGEISTSTLTSKCIKYVDEEYLSNHENINIGKLHLTSDVSNTLLQEGIEEIVTDVTISNNPSTSGFTLSELERYESNLVYRVTNNLNDNNKSGIERIERKFLARDLNAEKLNSVYRLHEYYNDRSSKNSYKKINKGFSNYNSINFYTIGNMSLEGSDYYQSFNFDKSHKNILVYPNLYKDNHQYDFQDVDKNTFSAYINLNKKNIVNDSTSTFYSYNAGCLLFIPDIVSIHVMKGSELDEEGKNSAFRLCIMFGENSFDKVPYSQINSDDLIKIEENSVLKYLISTNNILKFNNWHNVVLSYLKVTGNKYSISLYIDGVLLETTIANLDFTRYKSITSLNNSFITVGNKPYFSSYDQNTKQNFISEYFSCNKNEANDLEGPYANKYIKFGKNIDDCIVNSIPDENLKNYSLLDSLFLTPDESSDESFAFSGEIHDIRVYNEFADENSAKNIYENCLNENDILKNNLMFYVPVFYLPQLIKKKGLINLKLDENNKVLKQNIAFNFITNPYAFNFCGLNEVSVESFLTEFVMNVNPHVSFSNVVDYKEEYNIFSNITNEELLEISQKGDDPVYSLLKKVYSGSNSIQGELDILYRNNFIMPNDNGLQYQNIRFVFNTYFPETVSNIMFEENKNYYNPTFVFTKDFSDKSFLNSNFINFKFNEEQNQRLVRSDTLSPRSINVKLENVFINKVTNMNLLTTDFDLDTLKNFIESYKAEDSFEARRDILWNISNKNFHSFYYTSDENFLGGYNNVNQEEKNSNYLIHGYELDPNINSHIKSQFNSLINLDRSEFDELSESELNNLLTKNTFQTITKKLLVGNHQSLKYSTYSNPCSRLYRDSVDNSYNQLESNKISTKKINENFTLDYYSYNLPLYETDYNLTDYNTVCFAISSILYNKKIENRSFVAVDFDIPGSSGNISICLKDNYFGEIYRSDCFTKKATWNSIGNILYDEGFVTISHPGLSGFGKYNFKVSFDSNTDHFVHELNIPAYSGQFNVSNNNSLIQGLRINKSSFNLDEDFVYITDIHLHDENFNILAKARLANPFAKKNSDNVLFRLKMDF